MALAAIRSDPADALNDAQRLAVEHGEEPLLVIAGVGKTATLAHRLAHLVLAGVDPKRIMLATFSRRADGAGCAARRSFASQSLEKKRQRRKMAPPSRWRQAVAAAFPCEQTSNRVPLAPWRLPRFVPILPTR
jgi:hypothetical protein